MACLPLDAIPSFNAPFNCIVSPNLIGANCGAWKISCVHMRLRQQIACGQSAFDAFEMALSQMSAIDFRIIALWNGSMCCNRRLFMFTDVRKDVEAALIWHLCSKRSIHFSPQWMAALARHTTFCVRTDRASHRPHTFAYHHCCVYQHRKQKNYSKSILATVNAAARL